MASSTKIKVPKISTIQERGSSGNLTTTSNRINKSSLRELLGTLDTIRNNQVLQIKATQQGNNANRKAVTELDKLSKDLAASNRNYEKTLAEYKKNLAELAILDRQEAGKNRSQIEKEAERTSRGISSRHIQRSGSSANKSSFISRSSSSGFHYKGSSSSWMPYEGITDVARQTGDKISGGFVPSLALSIATGGALNPVIIRAIWQPLKEVGGFIKDTLMLPIKILQGLWGSIKNITNVLQKLLEKILYIPSLIIKGLWTGTKTVLSLPFKVLGGIGGMLGFGRSNNEKDASAVNNANDSKLYGRLDKIIGLLEKKSNNVKADEKKESSGFLSSILGFLPGLIKIGALLALGYGAFKIIGMDKIKEGWEAIKNSKQKDGWWGAIKTTISTVVDWGKIIGGFIYDWYEESGLKATIDGFIEGVKKDVKEWWEKDKERENNPDEFSIHRIFTWVNTKIDSYLQENWDTTFTEIKDNLAKSWNDFVNNEGESQVVKTITDAWASLTTWVSDLWNEDATNEQEGKFSIHGIITNISDWIGKTITGIQTFFSSVLEGFNPIEFNADAEKRYMKILEEYWDNDKHEWKEGTSLSDIAFAEVFEFTDNIRTADKSKFSIASIKDYLGKQITSISATVYNFVSTWWKSFKEGKSFGDRIKEYLNVDLEKWNLKQKWFNDNPDGTEKGFSDYWNDSKNGLKEKFGEYGHNLNEEWENLSSYLVKTFTDTIPDLIHTFVEWIKKKVDGEWYTSALAWGLDQVDKHWGSGTQVNDAEVIRNGLDSKNNILTQGFYKAYSDPFKNNKDNANIHKITIKPDEHFAGGSFIRDAENNWQFYGAEDYSVETRNTIDAAFKKLREGDLDKAEILKYKADLLNMQTKYKNQLNEQNDTITNILSKIADILMNGNDTAEEQKELQKTSNKLTEQLAEKGIKGPTFNNIIGNGNTNPGKTNIQNQSTGK